jgi:23S rRNA pseudouridine955/2504/2580 synthase
VSPGFPQVQHVRVAADSDGQRIDNFLLRLLPGVPKSHVYRLLRSGQVRVDGGRAKPDRKLKLGEEVRIPPVRIAERQEIRPPDEVLNRLREAIRHEDRDYLILDKPEGLAAHGGSGLAFGVIEAIRAWHRYEYIELAHRLDRDTSGLLLLAKNREALLRAQRAFSQGKAQKRYLALLCGDWRGGARDVDAPIGKTGEGSDQRVTARADGKASLSRFTPLQVFREGVLCEVDIFSGRTHQIRVHAEMLGFPVAGDRKYGSREQHAPLRERGLKRMFLHAHRLKLPADGRFDPLHAETPLPDTLRELITTLETPDPNARKRRRR